MRTLLMTIALAGITLAFDGCLYRPHEYTCSEAENRRPPGDLLEYAGKAGYDALGFLVDSARVVAIADSTIRLTAEESMQYVTGTFIRAPDGFLVARVPNDPNRRGGGALVWVGKGSDARVIYFYQ